MTQCRIFWRKMGLSRKCPRWGLQWLGVTCTCGRWCIHSMPTSTLMKILGTSGSVVQGTIRVRTTTRCKLCTRPRWTAAPLRGPQHAVVAKANLHHVRPHYNTRIDVMSRMCAAVPMSNNGKFWVLYYTQCGQATHLRHTHATRTYTHQLTHGLHATLPSYSAFANAYERCAPRSVLPDDPVRCASTLPFAVPIQPSPGATSGMRVVHVGATSRFVPATAGPCPSPACTPSTLCVATVNNRGVSLAIIWVVPMSRPTLALCVVLAPRDRRIVAASDGTPRGDP